MDIHLDAFVHVAEPMDSHPVIHGGNVLTSRPFRFLARHTRTTDESSTYLIDNRTRGRPRWLGLIITPEVLDLFYSLGKCSSEFPHALYTFV